MPEISKTYTPAEVEERWQTQWNEAGCFTADPARVSPERPAYSIVIPPPNVTGILTLGHVLNNTIQDILCRRARMLGKEVLWLPGTDHAGIATQNVVEKNLKKQGVIKHRDDLGREGLVEKIWEWKEKHGGIIIQQLKKLGASCDWSRERFTMDEDYSRCVQRVFVDLYKKGMIYRGKRMVNWCPSSLTALSDEEVTMKPQNGTMYHFKVEVIEEPGTWLEIATTRPEVIPGDTAIAVNPNDPRYAHLIGKHVRRPLPLENQAELPIVGDEHVDFTFGTGVLKVTPAHDKADFEIAQRHSLPVIDVMHPNGILNELAGKDLGGMERFAARKRAAELLTEIGSMVKEEPYQNNVGYSERADVPIEHRLSEQWFLKYPSVQPSQEVVAKGEMRFFPDRWAKVYDHWMGGLQDWCISRQLWWGHRVPVWSFTYEGTFAGACLEMSEILCPLTTGHQRFCAKDCPEVAITIDGKPVPADSVALNKLGIDLYDKGAELREIVISVSTLDPDLIKQLEEMSWWEQDPDVLDTWFSSWLWPFATMGWPNETADLKAFYPTTDLVTGPDIIFFWVARMIMAGYEYRGELPFKNVYFTGIIRDKQGRKMSKSLGNSPDPLDLIAKFGADALRFGIMRSAPQGADIHFDEQCVEQGRNFATKLWNAARFRQMQGDAEALTGNGKRETENASIYALDILAKLDQLQTKIEAAYLAYEFNTVAALCYEFFWGNYCDLFLEAAKNDTREGTPNRAATLAVMDACLSRLLMHLHPFMPHITEELWAMMGYGEAGTFLTTTKFPAQPALAGFDAAAVAQAQERTAAIYNSAARIRNLKAEYNLATAKGVAIILKPSAGWVAGEADTLALLAGVASVTLDPAYVAPTGTPIALSDVGEIIMPLEGLIDKDAERKRVGKELEKVVAEIGKVEAKFANPAFAEKVPASVLDEHRARLVDWNAKKAKLAEMLAALG